MKRLICLLALVVVVSGCGNSAYKKGYEDATNYKEIKKLTSEEYKRGYGDGKKEYHECRSRPFSI